MRISILDKLMEEANKRYDELKEYTNTDEGLEMIVLVSRTIKERHINDLRDEDTDEFIGIKDGEWIKYTHDIEYFQGPVNIKNESVVKLTNNQVLDYVTKLNDEDYMKFMKAACNIYRGY